MLLNDLYTKLTAKGIEVKEMRSNTRLNAIRSWAAAQGTVSFFALPRHRNRLGVSQVTHSPFLG
jgi:hypothetical protein